MMWDRPSRSRSGVYLEIRTLAPVVSICGEKKGRDKVGGYNGSRRARYPGLYSTWRGGGEERTR